MFQLKKKKKHLNHFVYSLFIKFLLYEMSDFQKKEITKTNQFETKIKCTSCKQKLRENNSLKLKKQEEPQKCKKKQRRLS